MTTWQTWIPSNSRDHWYPISAISVKSEQFGVDRCCCSKVNLQIVWYPKASLKKQGWDLIGPAAGIVSSDMGEIKWTDVFSFYGESWFESPNVMIHPYTSEIVSWCMEHGAITVFVSWCMVQSLFEQNERKKKERRQLTTYRPVGCAAGKNGTTKEFTVLDYFCSYWWKKKHLT